MNGKQIQFKRTWAMPNKHTFLIQPIRKLIYKYGGDFKNWIDPFAGENSPAEITNDLNQNKPTKYHLHAREFAKQLDGQYKGVLFDPPYSLTQVKECYNGIGIELMSGEDAKHFPKDIKKILSNKIEVGGYAICFGWNTIGFGKKEGFKMIEILLVSHGGTRNDTIVTVEQKIQEKLF